MARLFPEQNGYQLIPLSLVVRTAIHSEFTGGTFWKRIVFVTICLSNLSTSKEQNMCILYLK